MVQSMRRQSQGQVHVIDTGLKPVFSQKSATRLFVPLTGALDSTHLKEARTSIQVVGITNNFIGRMAYRMSDDGVVWSATVTGVGNDLTANGWYYNEGTVTSLTTDLKLFVQLGAEVSNSSGNTQVQHGLMQLVLQARNVRGRTVSANHQKVWSDGSTSGIFHAITAPMLLEEVDDYRATLELIASSGDVRVQAGYQVSNDARTWYSGAAAAAANTFTAFGTELTAPGIAYGTTFSNFAPSEKKKYVRFGVVGKNGTAGKPETGLVALRLDSRRT